MGAPLRIEPKEARVLARAVLASPPSGDAEDYQRLLAVVRDRGVHDGARLLCAEMPQQSAVACLVLMVADLAERAATGGA